MLLIIFSVAIIRMTYTAVVYFYNATLNVSPIIICAIKYFGFIICLFSHFILTVVYNFMHVCILEELKYRHRYIDTAIFFFFLGFHPIGNLVRANKLPPDIKEKDLPEFKSSLQSTFIYV